MILASIALWETATSSADGRPAKRVPAKSLRRHDGRGLSARTTRARRNWSFASEIGDRQRLVLGIRLREAIASHQPFGPRSDQWLAGSPLIRSPAQGDSCRHPRERDFFFDDRAKPALDALVTASDALDSLGYEQAAGAVSEVPSGRHDLHKKARIRYRSRHAVDDPRS